MANSSSFQSDYSYLFDSELLHPNTQTLESSSVLLDESSFKIPNSRKRKVLKKASSSSSPSQSMGEEKKKGCKKMKEEKKIGEDGPEGYIHVRARRGQATDSHSLAERVRREKISERMKLLQSLVPGCQKVTGKAVMLDEIINYVQSLQNQVELLSMKLASVNPMLYDFGMDIESFMVRPDQDLNNFSSLDQGFPTMETNSFNSPLETFATFQQQPLVPNILQEEEQKQRYMMNQGGPNCFFYP